VHPVSAVVAGIFVIWLVGQARHAGAGRLAAVVLALLGFQFALGLADVLLLAPVWMQILHLLGADLYWVALVTLAAMVIWPKAGATLLRQASNPQASFPVAGGLRSDEV
jgi:cytochrome c oxidase assembly protein subunit 15